MLIIPSRGRRRRGPGQPAAALAAALVALAAVLSTVVHRTGRGFPKSSFTGSGSVLPWVLGGLALAVAAALIVLVIVRANAGTDSHDAARDADDPHADDDRGDRDRSDDLRHRKMMALALALAVAAAAMGAAFYASTRHSSPAPAEVIPSTTLPRP